LIDFSITQKIKVMEIIQEFISEDIIYALGWTVMHSLWQAFAIAIILSLVLHFTRRKSAKIRYEASLFALFLVLVSAVSTFIWYYDMADQNFAFVNQNFISHDMVVGISEPDVLSSFTQTCISYFNTHLPMIVMIWLVGVAFFVLRLLGGLVYVQRLKYYRTRPLPKKWEDQLLSVSRKIPIKKSVKIMESAAIKVPMVIGYLKPFILLPIGAINQLEAEEVEAIIAHEVAHIYRNDFLMNIFISFVEVFFYYNPAVWWISGNIRLERENCCDDIAIEVCGNSLSYAKALVRLQELNAYTPSFAMPFSGRRNQLLHRIRRILNQPQNRNNIMERLMATIFLLFTVIFMSVHQNTIPAELKGAVVNVKDVVELEASLEGGVETAHKKYKLFKVRVDVDSDQQELELREEVKTRSEDVALMEGSSVDDRLIIEEAEPANLLKGERGSVGQIQVGKRSLSGKPANIVLKVMSDTIPERSKVQKTRLFFNDFESQKGQYITKIKNEEGQTVIVIAAGDGENIEILVDDDKDEVLINGASLAYGDTTIIVGESKSFKGVHWFSNDANSLFDRDAVAITKNRLPHLTDSENKFEYLFLGADSIKGDPLLLAEELRARQDILSQATARANKLREIEEQQLNEKAEIQRNRAQEKHLLRELKAKEEAQVRKYRQLQGSAREKMHKARTYINVPTLIGRQLKADGLIKDEQNFRYSLSPERLKVNGKKQSKALQEKYLKLHEELTGEPLDGQSKYEISLSKN
jgi:beta-lactamase regulating signal transducer with metallopeptidase domain